MKTLERYVPLYEFTLADFKNQASDKTKHFRKLRNKEKGKEASLAKLTNFDFSTNTAEFLTGTTYEFGMPSFDDGATSPTDENFYTIKIQFMELEKWKDSTWVAMTLKEFKEILDVCEVRLDCSCASYLYQGHRYALSQIGSAIYDIGISAPVWSPRHDGKGGLCKHLLGVVNSIGFLAPVILGNIRKEAHKQGVVD